MQKDNNWTKKRQMIDHRNRPTDNPHIGCIRDVLKKITVINSLKKLNYQDKL